jgi:tetratricopeptide (TPR) repeat protein
VKKERRLGWLRTAAWYLWILPDIGLRFVVQWWSTRPWMSLLWGLPAIVSGLALLAVEPWHGRTSLGEWVRRYDSAGMAALRRGDLPAADVCFRRIAFLDESSPASSYGLALTAEREKDRMRARGWMLRIAPEAEAGYAPAHFWLAKDLMGQKMPLDPQAARVLEHHLLQAARSPTHQMESRVNLVQLYMLRGETAKAIGQMEQVVVEQPAFQLDLAHLYALADRTADARRAAGKASEFFEARTLAEPRQPLPRQGWAASLVLQERYEEAVRVLTAGLSQPDPKPIEQALAGVYLQ